MLKGERSMVAREVQRSIKWQPTVIEIDIGPSLRVLVGRAEPSGGSFTDTRDSQFCKK